MSASKGVGAKMVNTEYVPEWYITPFQHVQYTLARNQLHMDLLFEDMDEADQFFGYGSGCTG